MIRERRDEDLDRLCAILESMEDTTKYFTQGARAWLEEHDAEVSWVFDMAPVTVAPTKNVVGHVQIHALADERAADCLAIGKFFVRPDTYPYGIGRYLLRESVTFIQRRGKMPVLDLEESFFLSTAFCEKAGFVAVPSDEPGVAPMVHTG